MENALLIIKPDGVLLDVRSIIDLKFIELELKVVLEKKIHLNNAQIEGMLSRNETEYIEYLCSGPVIIMVVRGHEAISKSRYLKNELRKMFNSDGIKNILHSAEPGNEYEAQISKLFPEIEVNKYSGYADELAYINAKEPESIEDKLNQCILNSSISKLFIVSRSETYEQVLKAIKKHRNKKLSVLTAIEYSLHIEGTPCSLLIYYPNDLNSENRTISKPITLEKIQSHVKSQKASLVLRTNPKYINEHLINYLIEYDLNGIVCYSPKYTLAETEILRGITLGNGLFCVGGSDGILDWGRNSVSFEVYRGLFESWG